MGAVIFLKAAGNVSKFAILFVRDDYLRITRYLFLRYVSRLKTTVRTKLNFFRNNCRMKTGPRLYGAHIYLNGEINFGAWNILEYSVHFGTVWVIGKFSAFSGGSKFPHFEKFLENNFS